MALAATLVDNFNDNSVDTTKWPNNYGTYSETGGRARVGCEHTSGTPDYAGYYSDAIYDLEGSQFRVRMYPAALNGATAAADNCYTAISFQSGTDGTDLYIGVDRGLNQIQFFNRVGYSNQTGGTGSTTLTYDATNHAWVGLRCNTTSVFFETSADGTTWTVRRTITSPAWVLSLTAGLFLMESARTSGTDNFAEFDNVNTTGVVTTEGDADWTVQSVMDIDGLVRKLGEADFTVQSNWSAAGTVITPGAEIDWSAASSMSAFEPLMIVHGTAEFSADTEFTLEPTIFHQISGLEWSATAGFEFTGAVESPATPVPTLAELVEVIRSQSLSVGRDDVQQTWLTSPVGVNDLTLLVADATQMRRGVAEIDDELFWVSGVDRSGNAVAIAPYGRGYWGSTKASHAVNSQVRTAPRFTAVEIKRAINEAIISAYPTLFGISSTDLVADGITVGWDIPDSAERILSVVWQPPGATQEWVPVRRWRETLSPQTANSRLEILEGIFPGSTIRVTYARLLTALKDNDDLLTDTGLTVETRDLVINGALSRLFSSAEAGRQGYQSIETSELNQDVPPGGSLTLGRWYFQLYQAGIERERMRLLNRYPPTVHLTR